ncbi:MAG: ComEC/Rec2 family competence protein, partial [Firmicutes bacterium]|nr:ComEC/Rec2 family competence protein [Bacillota bacterium]
AIVSAHGWRDVVQPADVLLDVVVPHAPPPGRRSAAIGAPGARTLVLQQDYADLDQLQPGVRLLAYAYLRAVAPGRLAIALMRRNITVMATASIYGVSLVGTRLDVTNLQTASAVLLHIIIRRASAAVGSACANLLAAFAFGDRSGVQAALVSALTAIGVVHAFVASGATIRMTIAPIARLAQRHLPRGAACALAAVALCAIVVLTGFAPPALRASCVFGYDIVAIWLGRPRDALTANGLALCVLAAVSPALLVDPGVILSLCAVTGLQWLPPLLGAWPPVRWIRSLHLRQWVARGCGAELCVTPLVAALFGQFAVLSLLINIFVYSVLEWVIPISAALLCICAVAPDACHFLYPVASTAARDLVADIEALSHLPLVLTGLHPSYVDVLIYYAVLWSVAQCLERVAGRVRRTS